MEHLRDPEPAAAPELVKLVTDCGFTILRQQTTSDGRDPPCSLLHAYDHAALTTDQVVLLAARDDAPAALTPQLDDGRARFRLGKRTRGLLRRIMGTARP